MRRLATLTLIAFMLAQLRGCCCLFRGFDKAFGEGLVRSMGAGFQRITVRLGTGIHADRPDLPALGPFGAVGQEPSFEPSMAGWPASATWLTLIEFGPVDRRRQQLGPGFKLQIPCPGAVAMRWGPVSFLDGWLRVLTPAWGPDWEWRAACLRAAPDRSWERAFVRDHGWTGGDGVASFEIPGGRIAWAFGDSWIGPVVEGRHAAGSTIVNNAVAAQRAGPTPPRNEDVAFAWGPPNDKGQATAWSVPDGAAPGDPRAEWFWPAGGGLTVTGPDGSARLLMFMTRLGRRDASDSIWNFESRGSTLVEVENPADPPGLWRQRQHVIAPLTDAAGRMVTWGTAILPGEAGTLVIYGIDATQVLDKRLVLARAPASGIAQFQTWSFWDGKGWSARPADAVHIVPQVASEVSIQRLRIQGGERLVMVYSELTLGPKILCRSAQKPEGPWSDPVTLYECPEPGEDSRSLVYSAKAHPALSAAGELLVSYCVNSTDFWYMASHAETYRPRFIRIPLAMLPR